MIDPLTALSIATTAVGQIRELISAGQDASSAIGKFAGAFSDVQEAHRRAANPPWYKSFSGSIESEAANAFAAKKRMDRMKAEVEQMIADHRKAIGVTPRKISDEEIVQRLVFSLVNEAAHILEEGIANKASDIDVVYIFGYGFPVYRGGPLNYANEVGLFNVVQAMKRFAKNPLDDAQFWEPAPLLAKLAAAGQTF